MKFWKKVLASVTAGVLCLGGAGLSGAESVQESMGRCYRRVRTYHILTMADMKVCIIM